MSEELSSASFTPQPTSTSRSVRQSTESISWLLEDLSPESHWTWLDVEFATGEGIDSVRRRWEFGCFYALSTREEIVSKGEQRFGGDRRIRLYTRHGDSLLVVPNNSIDFGYLLRIDPDFTEEQRLETLLKEVARTLKVGGRFRFKVPQKEEATTSRASADKEDGRGLKKWLKLIGLGGKGESSEAKSLSASAPEVAAQSRGYSTKALQALAARVGLSMAEARAVDRDYAVTLSK